MHKLFDGQTTQLLIKDLFCYPDREIVSARVVCIVALVGPCGRTSVIRTVMVRLGLGADKLHNDALFS